jgi:putative nucleotidyltransferase with HDIG domain
MDKPTPKTAEEFARKAFLKDKTPEDMRWHLFHSKAVGDCAILIAGKKKVDKELLKIAGWLHDIGQTISMDDHAAHSLKIAEKEFEMDEKLKDCILNHGSNGSPICEEAKLIFIADKVFMLNPKFVELYMKDTVGKPPEKKKKDLDFARKLLSKASELLEKI